jgi:putative ATP-binding cassette transporter
MSQNDLDIPHQGGFARKLWALMWPFFWSEQRIAVRVLLTAIVILTLGGVAFDVVFNFWYKDFYNSLQDKNEPEFWYQIRKFSILAVFYILIGVYNLYLKQMLHIRWRKWMTERLLARWLNDQTYYRLQFTADPTDNPEQRIEQDIYFFTTNAIDLPLGVLNAVVSFCSFVTVLWTISGPLSFALGGQEITIPGYMVWAAVLYAALGSWLTYLVGRPLIATNFGLQKANATFRFGMTRVRENAESVAFYRGERAEQKELTSLFDRVWRFWWDYMRQQKRMSWFVSGYAQLALIFPFVVASPRYFAGAIELGVLMQIVSAFGQVQTALSWFVNNFGGDTERGLAPWKATIDRLTGFIGAVDRAKELKPGIATAVSDTPVLDVENLDLTLPDGRALIRNLSTDIKSGDKVLISGPSGAGKTTLFRALAGIWPFGHGRLRTPADAKALFLPQRPYLPIGTLRDALAYPGSADGFDEPALRAALSDVNLEHLSNRLDEEANWSHELSIGEQQRVAIARALLLKPNWLYLDEATSALDAPNEQRMYKLLAERLPEATVLSIAHRPEVARFHQRRLAIDPASTSAQLTAIAAE